MSLPLLSTFRKGIVDTDTSFSFHNKDTLFSLQNVDIFMNGDNSVIKPIKGNYKAGGVGGGGKINETDVYVGSTVWDTKIYLFYTTFETLGDYDNYILEYDTDNDKYILVLKRDLGIPSADYTNIGNILVTADVVYGDFLYFTLAERKEGNNITGIGEPKRINIEDAKYDPYHYSLLSGNLPRPSKLIVSGILDNDVTNNLLKHNSYVFYKVLRTKYNERTVFSYPSDNIDVSEGSMLGNFNRINIQGFQVPDEISEVEIYMENDSSNTMFKIASYDTTVDKTISDISFFNAYKYPVADLNHVKVINYEFPLTAGTQELAADRIVYGDVEMYRKFVDITGSPINKTVPFNYSVIAENGSDLKKHDSEVSWIDTYRYGVKTDFEIGKHYSIIITHDMEVCVEDDDYGNCERSEDVSEIVRFNYQHLSETNYVADLNAIVDSITKYGMNITVWDSVDNNFIIEANKSAVTTGISVDMYEIESADLYDNLGLNTNFKYKAAIIYLDINGRNMGGTNITEIKNDVNHDSMIFNVISNLSTTPNIKPPYWATKYMIVRDKINSQITYAIIGDQIESGFKDNTKIVKIKTKYYINYFPEQKGKTITIYSKQYKADIEFTILDEDDIEKENISSTIDLELKDTYAYVKDSYTFNNGSVILYQPNKEIESKREAFFETSNVFNITRNLDGSVNYEGDGQLLRWYDTKIGIYEETFGDSTAPYPVTVQFPIMHTDIEKLGEINHLGRGAYTYLEEVNMHTEATLVHSQHYSPSTNYNGLNAFSSVYNNFLDVDTKYGRIEILYYNDTDLIVGQLRKWNRLLLNKSLLTSGGGNQTIMQNQNFFNNIVPYGGEYGITDRRSFAHNGFREYFADTNNGIIGRLSMDGISILNGHRYHEIFNMFSKQRNNGYCAGGFDPVKSEYVCTMSEEGKAIRFSEVIKESVGDYNYFNMAKEYITVNNRLYTIDSHGNDLWLENYDGGIQWGEDSFPYISFIVNDSPLQIKQFLSMSILSDTPFFVQLTTDNNNTDISKETFMKREDAFFADIPMSINSSDTKVYGVGIVEEIINNNTIRLSSNVNNVNVGDLIYFEEGLFIGTVDALNENLIITVDDFVNTPIQNKFVYCIRPSYVEGNPLKGNYCKIDLFLNETKDFTLKSVTLQANISSLEIQ